MKKFDELGLDPKILQAVSEAGYETPTPIQSETIPNALAGRDIIGIAQTGTGKTASFTLPMISMLDSGRARARMPRSLVLAPTRELASQVADNFDVYAKHSGLTKSLLIGGVSFKDQNLLLDRGVDVLIATPGRLLDHFERGKLLLTGVQILVVDEADRMLDMGFIPDIERIFKLTPFTRQTLLFSATMAPEIARITQEFLSNPVRIEVSPPASAGENIEQSVYFLSSSKRSKKDSDYLKRDLLRTVIRQEGIDSTNCIIFCNRKTDVNIVGKSLLRHGFNAALIHGDLSQPERTRTLTEFRNGSINLLVASDVAARGLDIPSVNYVINFDVPVNSEDYVHRIGRTGRAGRKGKALMFCSAPERKAIAAIERLIGNELSAALLPAGFEDSGPDMKQPPAKGRSPGKGRRARVQEKPPLESLESGDGVMSEDQPQQDRPAGRGQRSRRQEKNGPSAVEERGAERSESDSKSQRAAEKSHRPQRQEKHDKKDDDPDTQNKGVRLGQSDDVPDFLNQ